MARRKILVKTIQYKLYDWIFQDNDIKGTDLWCIMKSVLATVPEMNYQLFCPKLTIIFQPMKVFTLAKQRASETKCLAAARRGETDVMPNWLVELVFCYTDPKTKMMVDPERAKYWLPVDWYNMGMEHTTCTCIPDLCGNSCMILAPK